MTKPCPIHPYSTCPDNCAYQQQLISQAEDAAEDRYAHPSEDWK